MRIMEISFFIKGMIVGAVITAPIGPIGILCVNRTLSNGRLSGFMSGLGAVTGDGFYAVVAAYSITFISSFLSMHHVWFRIAGGVFLFLIGIRILRSAPSQDTETNGAVTLAGDYASAVLLTIANPVTIAVFAAAFAGLGLGADTSDPFASMAMVAGVVSGSVLSWFLLSGLVSIFRESFKTTVLKAINRIAGAAILVFAAAVLYSAAR